MLKSPKTNMFAGGLIKRTSSMLNNIESKTVHKDKGDQKKKTLSEVKPVVNISKNLESFLEITSIQKEVLPSHKLQYHAYES